MDLGIEGKRAAVAAASAGLGFATAAALAREGVRVAICGRDADRVADAVGRLGGDAVGLTMDVAGTAAGAAFVEAAIEALGGVDILVTNAGGPPAGTFASTELDAYQQGLELNLLSVVGMCHAGAPGMRDRGWGRIVAITSVAVKQPIGTLILSNTARSGATGFLKTLALELAPDGITVNSLLPGLHATDRLTQLHGGTTDGLGPVGRPEDFGDVAAFLCSDQARFITGAALVVAGGADKGLL